jgi:hypothetical protein
MQLRLKILGGALALLNAIALFLYFSPPGGTREELIQQSQQLRNQIAAARAQAGHMRLVAAKVQVGSEQASGFETRYFLPERMAYITVAEEIQRMAKASGLLQRDAIWSREPIEGSADLSLLNNTANYEGTYSNLMKFLYEADHSPTLLMLDQMTAAPQQKNGQINTAIRFQAIIRDADTGNPNGQSGVAPR